MLVSFELCKGALCLSCWGSIWGVSDGQVGCPSEFSVGGHVETLPWVPVMVW